MNDWLTQLAPARAKSDEDLLQDKIESLDNSDLRSMLEDLDPTERPTQIEAMQDKLAHAEQMGRELAQQMEKQAIIGALVGMAAKGIASAAGKKMYNGAMDAASGASGAFKYAGEKEAGVLQQAVGMAVKKPALAGAAIGAAGGALMAPRDPYTGQKQYAKGAIAGGALGFGAGHFGGKPLVKAVTNKEKPLLGQEANQYVRDAARASSPQGQGIARAQRFPEGVEPKLPVAGNAPAPAIQQAAQQPAPQAAQQAAPSLRSSPNTMYHGGPVGGNVAIPAQPQNQMIAGAVAPHPAGGRPDSMEEINAHHELMMQRNPQYAEKMRGQTQAYPEGYVPNTTGPTVSAGTVNLKKQANMQTLHYDPQTKTFMRQHLTPSTGGEAVQGTGAQPIVPGHTEQVRNSMTHAGEAPFGSREYLQARMQQAGVGRPGTPMPHAAPAAPHIPLAAGSGVSAIKSGPVRSAIAKLAAAGFLRR